MKLNKIKTNKKTKAILLITIFILSTITAAIPLASAVASITLSPTSGPNGKVVTVTGTGYTANLASGVLTITFGGLTTIWTGAGGTTSTGAITTGSTFTVPSTTPGTYTVVVSDAAGNTASTSYTITPVTLTITPTSGPSGNTILVSATGFLPSSTITTATFGGTPVTLSITSVGTTGAIYATFTSASITTPTTYPSAKTVVLTDSSGNIGTATYTLTQPSITLSTSSGSTGTTVTVTGSDFKAAGQVGLEFGTKPVTALLGASGDATAEWTTEEQDIGIYSAKLTAGSATGNAYVQITPALGTRFDTFSGGVSASKWMYRFKTEESSVPWLYLEMRFEDPDTTDFLDVTDQITTDYPGTSWQERDMADNGGFGWWIPGVGSDGGTLPINLGATYTAIDNALAAHADYASGDADNWILTRVQVQLTELSGKYSYFDDIKIDGVTYPIEPLATVSASGTFVARFDVPADQLAGAHTVYVYDGFLKDVTNVASATFTVTPSITVDMGVSSTLSGTNYVPQGKGSSEVTVTGSGFAVSAASQMTYSWGGPDTVLHTLPLTAIDSTGVLSTTISPQATWPTTAGIYSLTITDAQGNSATATIVATATGVFWVLSPTSGPVGTTVTATYFDALDTSASRIVFGAVTNIIPTPDTPTQVAYPIDNTVTFTVPNVLPGVHTVTGTVGLASPFSATFTVTTATPTMTLSPTSGSKLGGPVTITASGFIPDGSATYTFGGATLSTTYDDLTAGVVTATFDVPAYPVGTYPVVVSDGINTASATYTIAAPSVTLASSTIKSDTEQIKADLIGFDQSVSISTFTIGGVPVTITMGATTDAAGKAYIIFTSPSTVTGGNWPLFIEDASGNTYSTTVTVIPKITRSPNAGVVGTIVTLTGSGFGASKTLTMTMDTTSVILYTGTTAGVTTLTNGQIPTSPAVTFTVPSTLTTGVRTVTAIDTASPANTATTTFTVSSPEFTMTPSSGSAGITVTVTGTGWIPSVSTGWIKFDTATVVSSQTTDSYGRLYPLTGWTFEVPAVATGSHTVKVSDGTHERTATFTVITPSITLSATSGNVADIITITGSGFNPAEAITTDNVYFGATVVGALATTSVTAVASDGTLGTGVKIAVPAGSIAASYIVKMKFTTPDLEAVQTFTVTPKITASPTTGVLRGTTITIVGSGFAASSAITVTLEGTTIALSETTTSSTGAITGATYILPVDQPTGASILIVIDAAGNSASKTITVGVPSVTLSPSSGETGTTVQVIGSGFFPATVTYIVTFDGVVQTTSPLSLTSATGNIIGFFTVPTTATSGAHIVVLTDTNGNTATATFTVGVTEPDPEPVTDISLSVGWNLISLPLIPTDSSIEVVLEGVVGLESVWSYTAGEWYSYSLGAPSDLTTMVDGVGYWIDMTASATLSITGTEMPSDPFDPLPAYPVVEGYNLMGFKSITPMTVSDYLLGVDYVRVYEYVDGYNSLSADDYMTPGRGYWISVFAAGTIYP